MLPCMLSILVPAALLYGIGKVVNDRKKHSGRDYTDYFQKKKANLYSNKLDYISCGMIR